jgi:hypothetical protein
MDLNKFTVNYPKGFIDKEHTAGSGVRIRNYTNKDIEKYGAEPVIPSIVSETSITLPLETLTSTFNTIINTYKLTPNKYLALNKISEILTNEESVVKYALVKLNGTQGRCFTIKNSDIATSLSFPFVTYNPNLKETKKHLLMLFNKFLIQKEKNKEDIIMYEGQPLFIHLFAIIIDSFHIYNPEILIKKNCTDTFSMITLLELLLKKKYKHLLDFHINNIPLPKSEVLEVSKSILNQDDSSDDDWDTDDFVPRMQQHVQQNIQQEIIPSKAIEDKIDITPDIESHIADIPDDWNSL